MSNYSQNGGSRKDWRNFEQRRAQALAGNGAGGGGVDNYAYDNRSEPGTKFYNDNYGPNVVVPRIQGPNYAVSNSPSHSAGQMVRILSAIHSSKDFIQFLTLLEHCLVILQSF